MGETAIHLPSERARISGRVLQDIETKQLATILNICL